MSRNAFTEIMRFIRFYKKSERSQRLQTNKFTMSEIWGRLLLISSWFHIKPGVD